jgi:hypothetical protein
MRPYARNGKKIRINNRRKFNAGSRRVSREFSPKDYPRKIVPFHLLLVRLRKARRQGLTRDQRRHYITAMV